MYKAFIINLSKIPTSHNSAIRLQKSLVDTGIDARLFEGSYGNLVLEDYKKIRRQCHDWGLKGPERIYSQSEKDSFLTPGLVGCFDSHYRLWKLCCEMNEPIFIFEDDVIIQREFIPVEWKDVLAVAFSHYKKYLKYQHYLDSSSGDPIAADYKQATMPGNGGYLIKPHAAKILVETYKNSFLPADNAINQHLVTIQIHNYMMGRALFKTEGNVSLVRTKYWNSQQ